MGASIAFGSCYVHGGPFLFNPEQVPCVRVNPETGVPPDLEGSDPAGAVSVPVCPACAAAANVERRKAGLPLFSERDTAEDAARGLT